MIKRVFLFLLLTLSIIGCFKGGEEKEISLKFEYKVFSRLVRNSTDNIINVKGTISVTNKKSLETKEVYCDGKLNVQEFTLSSDNNFVFEIGNYDFDFRFDIDGDIYVGNLENFVIDENTNNIPIVIRPVLGSKEANFTLEELLSLELNYDLSSLSNDDSISLTIQIDDNEKQIIAFSSNEELKEQLINIEKGNHTIKIEIVKNGIAIGQSKETQESIDTTSSSSLKIDIVPIYSSINFDILTEKGEGKFIFNVTNEVINKVEKAEDLNILVKIVGVNSENIEKTLTINKNENNEYYAELLLENIVFEEISMDIKFKDIVNNEIVASGLIENHKINSNDDVINYHLNMTNNIKIIGDLLSVVGLTVKNKENNALQGAKISVNNNFVGLTDSNGYITLELKEGSYLIQALDVKSNVSSEKSIEVSYLETYNEKIIIDTQEDIIKLDTLNYEDVKLALESMNDGETLLLPEGSVEWTKILNIPSDKRIKFKGSGKEKTIITTNVEGSILSSGYGSSISELGFILKNDKGNGISMTGKDWKIYNCKFTNNEDFTIEAIIAKGNKEQGHAQGVIFNNEFISSRVLVYGSMVLMANDRWIEPLDLGSEKAVFIEDNTFTYYRIGNCVDSNYGARYVFRYNNVTDAYIEAHSVQGENRAARCWEIYNNTIDKKNTDVWTPFFLRGGTGVVFNNTVLGHWWQPTITIDNRRSYKEFDVSGAADGTSPWDGNEEENGYPARDQIGRSTDLSLWTEENPYPKQSLDPFYAWNNFYIEESMDIYVHNGTEKHIKENRDYYNNTERPNYKPYIYPHPLRANNF